MKAFGITLAVLIVAFFAIKTFQTPSVSAIQPSPQTSTQSNQKVATQSSPKAAVHQEDLTQFSNDLAKYMKAVTVKEGESNDMGELYQKVKISATCKPNQGEYHTRCWVRITGPTGLVDKATAENVRRRGNKFVWDHEA